MSYPEAFGILLNFLFVLGVMGATLYFVYRSHKRLQKVFTDLAAKHGLTYDSRGSAVYNGVLLPGSITNVVSGTDNQTGKTVQMFYSTYTRGSGKNKQVYPRTIAAVSIRKSQLHAFINSTLNDLTEQVMLDRSQRYIAEGSFGKYFQMYFPEKQHISGLSIFAPDVMELILMDYGYNDIEVLGDVVYLYEYRQSKKAEELEEFYQKALKLAAAIDDNAPRRINLSIAGEAASAGPATLLRRPTLRGYAVILGVGLFLLSFLSVVGSDLGSGGRTLGIFANGLYGLLFVALFAFAIVSMVRNANRRRQYDNERRVWRDASRKK